MWTPANNLKWQLNSECSKPENKKRIEWFFSKEPAKKYAAKNLCFSCPVRKECLQWALEHRQIWGIWGGKDEGEMRRALSVSFRGEEIRRYRSPNCPLCGARPSKLSTHSIEMPGGGRWTVAKVVLCGECKFSWRSRTSANAVDLYHQQKAERLVKKKKRGPAKKTKAKSEPSSYKKPS
jgi:WhiB family redox-sensing transcriptional regulator